MWSDESRRPRSRTNCWLFGRMVDQSEAWQQRGEFSTGTDAEQDGAGNEDGGPVQSSAKSPV
jgi:hypothetical protein